MDKVISLIHREVVGGLQNIQVIKDVPAPYGLSVNVCFNNLVTPDFYIGAQSKRSQ